MADYYDLLGVGRGASADDVKRAYRRLARQHHPDVNQGDAVAEEHFKEVTRAYSVLSDPEKRRRYDAFGEAGVGAAGAGPGDAFGFGGLSDMVDAFFGGDPFGARNRPRSRARRGGDLGMRVQLSFDEAVFGASREVKVRAAATCERCDGVGAEPGTAPTTCRTCGGSGQRQTVRQSIIGQLVTTSPCPVCQGTGQEVRSPCTSCHGEGRVPHEASLTLQVPAGVEPGMQVRYQGRGDAGAFGGPPGDLYVELDVRPHPVFQRQGDDLTCRLEVPFTVAALGGEVELETLEDEHETVAVEPGTQSGTVVRFRRRGVPHPAGRGRGDLLVELAVATPTGLSAEEEVLVRRLADLRGERVKAKEHGLFAKLRGASR